MDETKRKEGRGAEMNERGVGNSENGDEGDVEDRERRLFEFWERVHHLK